MVISNSWKDKNDTNEDVCDDVGDALIIIYIFQEKVAACAYLCEMTYGYENQEVLVTSLNNSQTMYKNVRSMSVGHRRDRQRSPSSYGHRILGSNRNILCGIGSRFSVSHRTLPPNIQRKKLIL